MPIKKHNTTEPVSELTTTPFDNSATSCLLGSGKSIDPRESKKVILTHESIKNYRPMLPTDTAKCNTVKPSDTPVGSNFAGVVLGDPKMVGIKYRDVVGLISHSSQHRYVFNKESAAIINAVDGDLELSQYELELDGVTVTLYMDDVSTIGPVNLSGRDGVLLYDGVDPDDHAAIDKEGDSINVAVLINSHLSVGSMRGCVAVINVEKCCVGSLVDSFVGNTDSQFQHDVSASLLLVSIVTDTQVRGDAEIRHSAFSKSNIFGDMGVVRSNITRSSISVVRNTYLECFNLVNGYISCKSIFVERNKMSYPHLYKDIIIDVMGDLTVKNPFDLGNFIYGKDMVSYGVFVNYSTGEAHYKQLIISANDKEKQCKIHLNSSESEIKELVAEHLGVSKNDLPTTVENSADPITLSMCQSFYAQVKSRIEVLTAIDSLFKNGLI